jgi:hypothetical protein
MSLLHEGGAAGDAVDWEAAATGLDMTSFPDDYREFVSVFGAGSIEGSLFVSIPRPGTVSVPLTVGRLPHSALRSESMSVWQEPGAGSRYGLEDMLVWGQTNSASAVPAWRWSSVRRLRTRAVEDGGCATDETGGCPNWWIRHVGGVTHQGKPVPTGATP